MSEPIPAPSRRLPSSAQAPGKCVLFGEHAVVRGAPELVLAIDLETQVVVRSSDRTRLNADPNALEANRYFREALAAAKVADRLDVRSVSRVPRAAGLGSSAAFVTALSVAIADGSAPIDRPALAQRCFEVERAAQGVGSPGDTSTSVAGGYVTLNAGSDGGEPLWSVRLSGESWEVRRAPDPGWAWIVAYSGIPRSTAEAVKAVTARLEQPDGGSLLEEFGRVAREGIAAVRQGDRESVGRLLARNHQLLREVGVSHPRIEALLEAAAPAAAGAKLTGAGRGGSVVALPLPGREAELVRRFARAGAVAYAVRPAEGVRRVAATGSGPEPPL